MTFKQKANALGEMFRTGIPDLDAFERCLTDPDWEPDIPASVDFSTSHSSDGKIILKWSVTGRAVPSGQT